MTKLQRSFYGTLRRDNDGNGGMPARQAYEMARDAELFSVPRERFYRTVKLDFGSDGAP